MKQEYINSVVEVKRVPDRIMKLKLDVEGVMLNVVSEFSPQVGCQLEKKRNSAVSLIKC